MDIELAARKSGGELDSKQHNLPTSSSLASSLMREEALRTLPLAGKGAASNSGIINDVIDHTRTTWSRVFKGEGNFRECVEVGSELLAAAVVARYGFGYAKRLGKFERFAEGSALPRWNMTKVQMWNHKKSPTEFALFDPKDTLARTYTAADKSIVRLGVMNSEGKVFAGGTGFIIDDKGTIATAAHVAGIQGSKIAKFVDSGKTFYKAEPVAIDTVNDVALLRLVKRDPAETFKALALREGAPPAIGEKVAVIGHPNAWKPLYASHGNLKRLIQLDGQGGHTLVTGYQSSPGLSGAPIFDRLGKVAGVHTNGYGGQSASFIERLLKQEKF